jgi:hypothetical protein
MTFRQLQNDGELRVMRWKTTLTYHTGIFPENYEKPRPLPD